jgi:hypothetical protein
MNRSIEHWRETMRKIILAAAAAAALIVATAPSFAGFSGGGADQPGHQFGEPGVANWAILPGSRK